MDAPPADAGVRAPKIGPTRGRPSALTTLTDPNRQENAICRPSGDHSGPLPRSQLVSRRKALPSRRATTRTPGTGLPAKTSPPKSVRAIASQRLSGDQS